MGISTANVLVTTEWLAEHLDDPEVVVAEVDENPDIYEDGHIAGAVKLHWKDDLQHSLVRDVVTKQQFERLMGERGISNDTTVVLYGDKNNWWWPSARRPAGSKRRTSSTSPGNLSATGARLSPTCTAVQPSTRTGSTTSWPG